MQIRHFLECAEISTGEPVDADHPDEGANILMHAADVGLGAGEQFGVIVQRGVLRHQVRRDLVGALGKLGVAEPLGAALDHPRQNLRRQALVASLLLPQDLLVQVIAE